MPAPPSRSQLPESLHTVPITIKQSSTTLHLRLQQSQLNTVLKHAAALTTLAFIYRSLTQLAQPGDLTGYLISMCLILTGVWLSRRGGSLHLDFPQDHCQLVRYRGGMTRHHTLPISRLVAARCEASTASRVSPGDLGPCHIELITLEGVFQLGEPVEAANQTLDESIASINDFLTNRSRFLAA